MKEINNLVLEADHLPQNPPRFYVLRYWSQGRAEFEVIDSERPAGFHEIATPAEIRTLQDACEFVMRLRSGETLPTYRKAWTEKVAERLDPLATVEAMIANAGHGGRFTVSFPGAATDNIFEIIDEIRRREANGSLIRHEGSSQIIWEVVQ